ncbi:uncharacterized protein LOC117106357 [Anneissia japonica]|uniref:uncharacterized protein LOC117106357 n=1 Tax=Anneissia japonica TaxID=1529436 RepID=UPI001425ADDB|nr:uncharacterized protein LOC117106357 [Anneissia japonica]
MTSYAVLLWMLRVVIVQIGSGSRLTSSASGLDTNGNDTHVTENEFDDIDVCTHHQTCHGRCGLFLTRNSMCHCDPKCELYGDCCYDYWSSCTNSRVLNSSLALWERTVCMKSEFEQFYLISKCRSVTVNEHIRSSCEEPNPDDFLLNIPVSDSSNLAYSNLFCALCNGVSITNVEGWKVMAKCRQINDDYLAAVFTSSDQSLIQNNLETILSKIYLTEDCNLQYKPIGGNSKRYCSYEHGINYCPIDFPDKKVANNCKRYKATVHAGSASYANPHCARCHGEVDYTCKLSDTQYWTPFKDPGLAAAGADEDSELIDIVVTVPITILVDFTSGSLSVETPSKKVTTDGFNCGSGRVYNPFKEVCIKTICEHGKILTEHGCIYELGNLKKTPIKSPSTKIGELVCICRGYSNVQVRYNVNNTSTANVTLSQITSLLKGYNTSFKFKQHDTSTATISFKTSECQLVQGVFTIAFQQFNSEKVLLENVLITQVCLNENLNITSPTEQSCISQSFDFTKLNITKGDQTTTVTDGHDYFTLEETSYRVEMTFNVENDSMMFSTLMITNCSSERPRDPTCPLIVLDAKEFDFTSNNTWIYQPTGHQFTNDKIIFSNETITVCTFFLPNGTRQTSSKLFVYEETLQLINLVGVSCSLLGLFLTCLTSCVSRPTTLRTNSGKIVMNIAISLFFAQFGTLFTGAFVQFEHACAIIAAVMHYLWLVAFMCMFVMSLTLFKSFRSFKASLKSRYENQSINLYLYFSWGIPLAFVAILLIIHFCDCVPFKFTYGDDTVCWIRDEFAALIVFGVPMATIMGVNSFLFVVIVCGIHRSKENSRKIRGSSKKKDIINNLVIYAKISCIMGLTWTIGCVASFIDERFLWYIFVIMNSMQGVFIFLSFSATKLVALLHRKQKNNQNVIDIRTIYNKV